MGPGEARSCPKSVCWGEAVEGFRENLCCTVRSPRVRDSLNAGESQLQEGAWLSQVSAPWVPSHVESGLACEL